MGFRPAVSAEARPLQGMAESPRGFSFLPAGAMFVRARLVIDTSRIADVARA